MKTVRGLAALLIFATAIALAQPPTPIIPGSAVLSAPMNANFLGLYTGRVGRWSGAGVPGSYPFSILGDIYVNTSASPPTAYFCARATACSAVATGNWQLMGSGAGGGNAYTLVTFGATANFARTAANQQWAMLLTGNVTAPTTSGLVAGDIVTFDLRQDGTGSRTFAAPTGFSEMCTISSTANIGTKQTFYWDGSAAHAITPCVTTVSSSDVVLTDAVNTFSAAGSLNLSASTVANAFRLPVVAGATATSNGALDYDSTNDMLHAAQASGDAKVPQFTVTPANGDCATWVVSGSNYKLGNKPCVASVFNSGTITVPTGMSVIVGCTSTCTVPVPVPVANYQICVKNDAGVSTVITLSALGSSAMYPKADDSGYGTAGTGTMVSTAAVGNKVCLIGRDATHYELGAVNASANWTVN